MKRKSRAIKRFVWAIEPVEQRLMMSVTAPTPAAPAGYFYHSMIQRAQSFNPNDVGGVSPIGLTPQQVRGAYLIDQIKLAGGVVGDGTGQTIGIVDAFDLPTAFADLQKFDQTFGLPDPPSFTKFNQQGNPSPLPTSDTPGGWGVEEALDIEWAHAIAPKAAIVVYEANSSSGNDLDTAVFNAARNPAVTIISMSFGGSEYTGETQDDGTYFVTPAGHDPITFLASAGDAGIYNGKDNPSLPSNAVSPSYPATSPNVVAVGGTSLSVSGSSYVAETAWGNGTASDTLGGGGGGISNLEPQPEYQVGKVSQSTTKRTYPDVAWLADPATGVPVISSYDFGASTPWAPSAIGGTSLACPMWGGLMAIADQGRVLNAQKSLGGRADVLPKVYSAPSNVFHDIVAGNNGLPATLGYDLASGWGSPIGDAMIAYLAQAPVVPPIIGDRVFSDSNGNGIQDAGEIGLGNITVELFSPGADGLVNTADDVFLQSTVTTSTGGYLFGSISPVPASYFVKFIAPATFLISPQHQGADPSVDSDADPATGDSQLIPLVLTSDNRTIDCGMYQQTITISDVSLKEGDTGTTNFAFTVTVLPAPVSTISVGFTTADVTATLGDNDYTFTSGSISFAPGVSVQTINVPVIGDFKVENDEKFHVNLTPPANFVASKTVGVGTIINDDFPVASLSGDYSAVKPNFGNTLFPFTINLNQPAPFVVSVPYSTIDNTAVNGLDYISQNSTATFAPGVTSITINVTVIGGVTPQPDKKFGFSITGSPTENEGTPSSVTGTILTNSPPGVTVSDSAIDESLTGVALMPFNIDVRPSQIFTTTLNYATSDGTAIAGVDYTPISGTLTFVPGSTRQTVYVPVARQFLSAQDKTLTMTISNVTGGLAATKTVATGTIHYPGVHAITFDERHKATYNDYLGNPVTLSLKGSGTGTVIFLGTQSAATDAFEITVDGSTPETSLISKVGHNGQTSFTNIAVNGSIGSILGKTTNALGTISTTGSLGSLSLNFLHKSTINIGTGGFGSVALNFSRVLDTSITSAIPISSLTAVAYLNTDGVQDTITAPSVGTVKVKGSFGGTIVTTAVAQIVAGSLDSASVMATNSIGSVTAGSIADSTLFAGVATGITALPSSAGDFANQNAKIGSVKVKSGDFSNTQIASWKIGSLNLRAVQTAVTGADFGVSASSVASVKAFSSAAIHLVNVNDPTDSVVTRNFVVRAI